jgi:hypothetical protein
MAFSMGALMNPALTGITPMSKPVSPSPKITKIVRVSFLDAGVTLGSV